MKSSESKKSESLEFKAMNDYRNALQDANQIQDLGISFQEESKPVTRLEHFQSRVVALVTLFHPTADCVKNVVRFAEQCDFVICCDNSDEDNGEVFKDIPKCQYIANRRNLGLSVAFNAVLSSKVFDWREEDFVIFFDQDACINSGHIQKLVGIYLALTRSGLSIGALGPCVFNRCANRMSMPRVRYPVDENTFYVDALITSSMLTTFGKLKSVGFWNEDIFLDYADFDLCFRMRALGLPSLMTRAVLLNHASGSGEKSCFGLRVIDENPLRAFYQVRDVLRLVAAPETPKRIRLLLGFVRKCLLQLLLLNKRSERFRYMFRGLVDYLQKGKGAYVLEPRIELQSEGLEKAIKLDGEGRNALKDKENNSLGGAKLTCSNDCADATFEEVA